ncbi:MAG: thioredoxin [Bacilli bacterium]|jgi:thioredoxin 1|nr:thioredoxin [Bacilli bacterium]MDD4057051.1 thioredoxin [Bacilli bacterium]MDY0209114.1 thioredoxin [Bacilli bacterium]
MVEKINEKQFKELKKEFVVADFYADWCGPCKMIAPFLKEIAEEIPDITFVKINVDENENLAAEFSVMSIPTLIIFKNGVEIERKIGFVTKPSLKAWILEKTQ